MIIDLLTFDSGSSSRSTLVRHIWKETKRKKKLNQQSIKSLYSNEQASFNGLFSILRIAVIEQYPLGIDKTIHDIECS